MMTYIICDGNDYLKWFGNNCIWFTQTRCEALTFHRQEEAEIVARTLNPLASSGLRVKAVTKGHYRQERAELDRRFFA